MSSEIFSNLEAAFLSFFNQGINTFDKLLEAVPYTEYTLNTVINSLTQKNIIVFDKVKKIYIYDKPVIGDKIILEGNIMLPVTVIRKNNQTIIIRGKWYTFDADFDIRRIIWNVSIPESKSSTIIDMIQNTVLKEKKSKIQQAEHYKNIQNKILPYNQKVKFNLNIVGEELTDIDIIFLLKIAINQENSIDNSDSFIEFKGFRVKSLINTQQMVDEITATPETRDYNKIEVNKVFNFSDFVYLKNEIPIAVHKDKIEYIKITSISKKIEITYYELLNNGKTVKVNSEEFLDLQEGLNFIKKLFDDFAKDLLLNYGFLVNLY